MHLISLVVGVTLIVTILSDTFETIILPRRVTRRVRLTSLFYRSAWQPFSRLAMTIKDERERDKMLSLFGPLSLFLLLGIWAIALIIGYALVFWGSQEPLRAAGEPVTFWTYLYLSGVTFFTLGYGDVSPVLPLDRFVAVVETANGFGLLA